MTCLSTQTICTPSQKPYLSGYYQVDGYVKIFPKVEHGWTVRYDVGNEAAVKPAEEAHQNMLEWFAKYVK